MVASVYSTLFVYMCGLMPCLLAGGAFIQILSYPRTISWTSFVIGAVVDRRLYNKNPQGESVISMTRARRYHGVALESLPLPESGMLGRQGAGPQNRM